MFGAKMQILSMLSQVSLHKIQSKYGRGVMFALHGAHVSGESIRSVLIIKWRERTQICNNKEAVFTTPTFFCT